MWYWYVSDYNHAEYKIFSSEHNCEVFQDNLKSWCFFKAKILASDNGDLVPCCHARGYYVATIQYHPLDFSDRPLNCLSFSSDHLIYLGLLQWIYCLVSFQNWNVKSSVMYAVALCCESSTDPPKAASSWSLDRARNK